MRKALKIGIVVLALALAGLKMAVSMNEARGGYFRHPAWAAFHTPREDTVNFETPYDSCHQARPICGDTSIVYFKPPYSLTIFFECCPGQTYYTDCCRSWGCLTSIIINEPRWFLLRIASPGKIQIEIRAQFLSSNGTFMPLDISYMIFGPFYTPTGACVAGLVDSVIVDCRDALQSPLKDTATIPWGNTGEFYLLNIDSDNGGPYPLYISFRTVNLGQPGYGTLDCDMTIYCQILSITANASVCNPASNTFTLSGRVYFVNAPQTGQLVVWDNTTGYGTTFNAPFSSPVDYSIPGLPCDNQMHTVTAMFWDSASCNLSTQFQAPVLCPDATLSGGGGICENTGGTVPLSIYVNPNVQMPVTLQWSIDGIPQPAISTSGPFPLILQVNQPGVYTLDTAYNALCAGNTQGQAQVFVWPSPQPNLGNDVTACEGDEVVLDAGAGFSSYLWSTGDNTQTLTVTKSGEYSVIVSDSNSCQGADTVSVSYLPKPSPKIIYHH